jgi:hypothetical protein
MLVKVAMDRTGCITLTPVSERWQKRFAVHLRKYYSPQADGTAFLQADYDVEAFLADLPADKAEGVRQGWTETIRMDPWTYGHYRGRRGPALPALGVQSRAEVGVSHA